MTQVMGFEELLSDMSDRDPRSSFMTESAWPHGASLCSLPVSWCLPEPSDRLRKPDGLSWVEIPWLGLSKSYLRRRRPACAWWCFGSCARRAVVVGHTQAMSRLTRRRSIGQGASHRSGRILSYPIRIEWGKGEGFSPSSFHLSPITAPFPTNVPFFK